MYWVNNSTAFFKNYVGSNAQKLVRGLIKYYRFFHPNKAVELAFLPKIVREMIRGLSMYDPTFGAAFYGGSWNKGFSHAEALQQIKCPVLLIQANTSFMDDGTLNGAMSEEMAARAMKNLHIGKYIKVNSGHVVNMERSDEFSNLLIEFFIDS